MIGIYKVTYIPENKVVYIGQSINIEDRFKQHKYSYKNQNESSYNTHFYRSLRKHGIENFLFEPLEECSEDLLNEREIYWISYFDTFKNGCNSTERRQNFPDRVLTEDEADEIKRVLKSGELTFWEILTKYRLSSLTLSKINKREVYYDDNKEYPLLMTCGTIVHCTECGKEIQYPAKLCKKCSGRLQDTKTGLSVEELIKILKKNNRNFSVTGKEVGCDGNAIRHRLKSLNLPFHSSDYQKPKEKKEKGYNPPPKRCAKLDEEGNFLEVYPSVRNAEKIYNAPGCISRVCNNRRPAYHGFKWRIISEEEYQNFLAK